MPTATTDLSFVGAFNGVANCANFSDVAVVDQDAQQVLNQSNRSVPCATGYRMCMRPAYNSFGFLGTNSPDAAIQNKTKQTFGTYTVSATPDKPSFCQYDQLDKSTYLNDVGSYNTSSQGYFYGDTAPEEQHWGCGCFHQGESDRSKKSCCIDGDRRACPVGFDSNTTSCDATKRDYCSAAQNKNSAACVCYRPTPKGQFSASGTSGFPRRCWDPKCYQSTTALKDYSDTTQCVATDCNQYNLVQANGSFNNVSVAANLNCSTTVNNNINSGTNAGDAAAPSSGLSANTTCTGTACQTTGGTGAGASAGPAAPPVSGGDSTVVAPGVLPGNISDKLFGGGGSSGSSAPTPGGENDNPKASAPKGLAGMSTGAKIGVGVGVVAVVALVAIAVL